jgi:uncharacterized protein
MRPWVVNTSPLLFLSKLDRLDLLKTSSAEVLVPPAVVEEIQEQPDDASRRIEEALSSWLHIEPVQDRRVVEVLLTEVDAGESEVIALAQEVNADRVVMDDLDGRRLARRLGLNLVGTLGLLLLAKQQGKLESVGKELERLRQVGFRVGEDLWNEALQRAGEEDPWPTS